MRLLCALALALLPLCLHGQTPDPAGRVIADQAYRAADPASPDLSRCKLDLYLPANAKDFPTLVWFHGGGLMTGDKNSETVPELGRALAREGIALAGVNYRLNPQVKYPAYVEDAAAAVAWVRAHIAEHHGSPKRIFVGGHSAGGYLAYMLAMDPLRLVPHDMVPTNLAGLVPVSGQTVTHSTVRKERGFDRNAFIVDEAAPLHYLRPELPPVLALFASKDLPMRAEENQLLIAGLKAAGHKAARALEIADRDHVSIVRRMVEPNDPAYVALRDFVLQTPPAP